MSKKATKKAADKSVKKKAKKATKAVKKKSAKVTTKPVKKATKKVTKKAKSVKKATKAKVEKKPTKSEGKAKIKELKKSQVKVSPKTVPVKKKKAVFKMTAFVKKQNQRLLDLRDQFINAIKGISQDTLRGDSDISANGMHQGDAGSDAYDRDYALSILAKEQDALYEIERALHRIETGSYGICQMSGEHIPQLRLEVLPFARLTVECQTLWEQKHGKKRYTIREGAGFTELM